MTKQKTDQKEFVKRIAVLFQGDYDQEYYDRLKALAIKTDRSMAGMALYIIRQYVDGQASKVGYGA